jgi:hypothetical protein
VDDPSPFSFFLRPLTCIRTVSFTIQSVIIIWTPKTKSLLPSPAYQQAGFTKGRNYPSLAKRGEGRFPERSVFFIMDSLVK